jgi:hypothetical protein
MEKSDMSNLRLNKSVGALGIMMSWALLAVSFAPLRAHAHWTSADALKAQQPQVSERETSGDQRWGRKLVQTMVNYLGFSETQLAQWTTLLLREPVLPQCDSDDFSHGNGPDVEGLRVGLLTGFGDTCPGHLCENGPATDGIRADLRSQPIGDLPSLALVADCDAYMFGTNGPGIDGSRDDLGSLVIHADSIGVGDQCPEFGCGAKGLYADSSSGTPDLSSGNTHNGPDAIGLRVEIGTR